MFYLRIKIADGIYTNYELGKNYTIIDLNNKDLINLAKKVLNSETINPHNIVGGEFFSKLLMYHEDKVNAEFGDTLILPEDVSINDAFEWTFMFDDIEDVLEPCKAYPYGRFTVYDPLRIVESTLFMSEDYIQCYIVNEKGSTVEAFKVKILKNEN